MTARGGGRATCLENAVDAPQRRQRVVQMARLGQLDDEAGRDNTVARRADGGAHEVDMVIGQDPGDVRQQPPAVQGLDLDLDEVGALGVLRPVHRQDALGLVLELIDILAVAPSRG